MGTAEQRWYERGHQHRWICQSILFLSSSQPHANTSKWSVENSVDNMNRQGKDVHNTNPGEELNYHGLLNTTTPSPQRGANYGYPECFSAWDPSVLPNNANIKVGTQFLIGTPSGSNTDAMCLQRQAPRLTFPSHTAPLDVKFSRNGTAAYIAFHGSW